MRSGIGMNATNGGSTRLAGLAAGLWAAWLAAVPALGLAAGQPSTNSATSAPATGLTNPAVSRPAQARSAERQPKRPVVKPGPDERWLEQWGRLSPEQRQAKLKELRQKYGFGLAPHDSVPPWRQHWETLSPEQRRARLAQWRQQRTASVQFSPKERELRRQQLRQRLDQAIAALRLKASNNLITVEERNRLDRLETLARRFKTAAPAANQPAEPARVGPSAVPVPDLPQVPTPKPDAP